MMPAGMKCGDANAPRIPFAINFYYEIRQFLDAIQGGKSSKLTFERGRYIQTLIDAAQFAADSGEMVSVTEVE